LVLYDEPTTGLDPITSEEISHLILDLQQKYKNTSIIITHDVDLARETANRIVFLMNGIVYFEGTYDDMLNSKDEVIKHFFKRQ